VLTHKRVLASIPRYLDIATECLNSINLYVHRSMPTARLR
jgi:hypothetical protein